MEGGIKADGRDVIPSIYTSGMLDKYLDGNYIPSFETAVDSIINNPAPAFIKFPK